MTVRNINRPAFSPTPATGTPAKSSNTDRFDQILQGAMGNVDKTPSLYPKGSPISPIARAKASSAGAVALQRLPPPVQNQIKKAVAKWYPGPTDQAPEGSPEYQRGVASLSELVANDPNLQKKLGLA